jgi:acyl-CoA thioester hydrolase
MPMSAHERSSRAQFALPVRVYYEDTDAAGVAYYASYLRYLERARTEWLRALGWSQEQMARESGIGFAVRALSADYIRPARLDDELAVVSEIEALGRAQITFDQRVLRGSEALLTATMRVACVDLRAMKPIAIPAPLRERFQALL